MEIKDPVVLLVHLEQEAWLATLATLALPVRREKKENEGWMVIQETKDHLGLLVSQ